MKFVRNDMNINTSRIKNIFIKTGFFSLILTLLVISFPRFISLYTLAILIVSGIIIWTIDFQVCCTLFKKNWQIIIPPVIYFLIHFISIILQKEKINNLETELMFIMIPLFGISIFYNKLTENRIHLVFKAFETGLILVSIFLLTRFLIILLSTSKNEILFSEYFFKNNINYVSTGFSALEHPSYLSLKLNFALLLLINFWDKWHSKKLIYWGLPIIFSVMIVLLASKAGIIMWIILMIVLIVKNTKSRLFHFYVYLILIHFLVLSIFFTVKYIERINFFIRYTKISLNTDNFDWKNLDQRTREWYAAIQLIKEKPVFGHGLAKVENRMVEEYKKNGWEEEARLRFNAHNQFLEAQMTFGIPGTLSLIWMLITPVLVRKRLKYPKLAVAFSAMMSFFLLFESMFNRQWGIMFFMLFYCILLSQFSKNESETKNTVSNKLS